MKKFLIRALIVLIVLLLLAAVGVHFFLDSAIKRGVETVGPKVTKVDVKLGGVSLSLLSGSGKIKGLVIGNPPGFKTPSAINVGTAGLKLQPKSLLGDKVIIESVSVDGPEVTLENQLTSINLKKILANLQESAGAPGEKKPAEPSANEPGANKKLQVNDFLIKNGKVHVSVNTPIGSQSATVALPEIHLKDLGTGPEGITPVELAQLVLKEIIEYSLKEGEKVVADIAKGAQYSTGDITKQLGTNVLGSSNTLDKAAKGLGDLLNKGKK